MAFGIIMLAGIVFFVVNKPKWLRLFGIIKRKVDHVNDLVSYPFASVTIINDIKEFYTLTYTDMSNGCKMILNLFFLLNLTPSKAQVKTWPIVNFLFKNQFDRNGYHHGRWVFLTDAVGDQEQMKTRGRYRHGYMVGKWKTFSADRKLRKMESGRLVNGNNLIETTQYHPNGKVERKGVAVLERSGKTPRFFLKDEWLYYHQDGSKEKSVVYEEGWPVRTTYADGSVVVSKAPPKPMVYRKGEGPPPTRPRVGSKMIQKGGETILIEYHEKGDSTVTVMPKKAGQ